MSQTSLLLAASGLMLTITLAAAPMPQTPPPAPPPQAARSGGESFPAQQRPPADPAQVERGRTLYGLSCSACHGADARGGQLGGPNLLRSPLVLNDQRGELIQPVVQQGRPGTAMVPVAMAAEDIAAVAAFLHSLQASSRGQGAPPPGPPVELNIVVGDARAGEKYFVEKCSSCHSPTGDLQGIATRITDARTLQNTWVSGRAAGRGAASPRRTVTATITQPSGEKLTGRLVRIDDFLVTIALADGTIRSIRRDGPRPRVDVVDPLEAHRTLLGVYTNANMRDVTAYLVTLK